MSGSGNIACSPGKHERMHFARCWGSFDRVWTTLVEAVSNAWLKLVKLATFRGTGMHRTHDRGQLFVFDTEAEGWNTT